MAGAKALEWLWIMQIKWIDGNNKKKNKKGNVVASEKRKEVNKQK